MLPKQCLEYATEQPTLYIEANKTEKKKPREGKKKEFFVLS